MPEWHDVPGWEDTHQVSNDGCVRTKDRWVDYADGRRRHYQGRVLKPNVRGGRHLAQLHANGKEQLVAISILVASAFIGARPDGHEVRHLDGDPSNNALANLAYGTSQRNSLDAVAHGTVTGQKLTEQAAADLRRRWKAGEWTSYVDASKVFGVTPEAASQCIRGVTFKHLPHP